MAPKKGATFTCSACGAAYTKWAGKCDACGAWNSIVEEAPLGAGPKPTSKGRTIPLTDLATEEAPPPRASSGIGELDRVLGGGLVPASAILVGGDPGIGKSTLLLQAAASFARRGLKCMYISGEEAAAQVRMRAQRLGLTESPVILGTDTNLRDILTTLDAERPGLAIIDSIQTMWLDNVESAPGSVSQVRASAHELVSFAKRRGVAVVIVGHVTKEGAIAGPRVLEHMVDTVLYFEGDPSGRLRVLRAVKNRYGPVNELGVFAMTERGLKEVNNPSAIFLSRHELPVAGSVIMVTREGTRPLLVEIQALVDECHGGNPRRVTLGLEQNRLAMLLAVLHQHGGVAMYDQDVYVNAVGGVRINETAADLAVLLAALSSFRDRPLPTDLVVFGEVGLAGEIRPVPNGEERLREAAKHGFKQAVVPRANLPRRGNRAEGMEIRGVTRLSEVLGTL